MQNRIPERTNYERGRIWAWSQTVIGSLVFLGTVYMWLYGGPWYPMLIGLGVIALGAFQIWNNHRQHLGGP